MGTWRHRSFAKVEHLVAFVNAEAMRAEQFKVVSARDSRGGPVFVLLFEQTDPGGGDRKTIVEAELLPVVEAVERADVADAITQAEEIIHRGGNDSGP
ncbi:MAG: hypothetical protein H0U40_13565 [Chloroflexia bacterium]|nr:hypothetical protein [Chloroflexia bacterium]